MRSASPSEARPIAALQHAERQRDDGTLKREPLRRAAAAAAVSAAAVVVSVVSGERFERQRHVDVACGVDEGHARAQPKLQMLAKLRSRRRAKDKAAAGGGGGSSGGADADAAATARAQAAADAAMEALLMDEEAATATTASRVSQQQPIY